MRAKKIYGDSIYVNNEKIILTKQAIKVLKYGNESNDEHIQFVIIGALAAIAESEDYLKIIEATEKTDIVEIDKISKNCHFEGFAVISNNTCYGLYLKRDNSLIYWGTAIRANEVYMQFNELRQ